MRDGIIHYDGSNSEKMKFPIEAQVEIWSSLKYSDLDKCERAINDALNTDLGNDSATIVNDIYMDNHLNGKDTWGICQLQGAIRRKSGWHLAR